MPETRFESFPKLPDGMRYGAKGKDGVTVVVDVNKLDLQTALKQLLDLFRVADIDVYNADLEAVIRHMYESASSRA